MYTKNELIVCSRHVENFSWDIFNQRDSLLYLTVLVLQFPSLL